MLTIVKHPNPILDERMPEFDFDNPITDPAQLEKDMIETMLEKGGIGLAANQVGVKTRMFVMGHPKYRDHAQAFFNPVIAGVTDDTLEEEEGCLSFPNIYVKIKRPRGVLVRFQNSKGETQEAEFFGTECRCFLHEFDHLEGITYKDRLSTLKWALAVKKSIKRKFK
jgi:peptide deformylase